METLSIILSIIWTLLFASVIVLCIISVVGNKSGKEQDKIIKKSLK
jgi:hypothetical protein